MAQQTMSLRNAAARFLGGVALAIGPYVLHVLPRLWGGDVLFRSIPWAFVAFAVCGGLCGWLCGYVAIACSFVALVPSFGLLRITLIESRDALPFLYFYATAAMVFSVAALITAALANRMSTIDDAGSASS